MNVGTIEVGLAVDSSELQRGLNAATGNLQKFSVQMKQAASAGLVAFNNETTEAALAQSELSLQLGQVRGQLNSLASAYQSVSDPRLERQIVQETAALRQQEVAIREQIEAMRQADSATTGFARSSGLANNVALEFGRGLGDLRYSAFAAFNNFEQLTGQFALLRRQAGGTRAALSAVGSSLLGPVGLVAGFSAVTLLGPKLLDFFQDTRDEASKTASALSDVANELLQFGLNIEGIDVDTPQGAGLVRGAARARAQALEDQITSIRRIAQESGRAEAEVARGLEVNIEDLRRRADGFREIAEEASRALGRMDAAAELADVLERAGISAASSKDEVKDLGDELQNAFGGLLPIVDANAQKIVDLFDYIESNRLPDLFGGNFARNRQLLPLLEIPPQIEQIQSKTMELGEAFRTQFAIGRNFVDDLAASFGDAVFSIFDFGGALSEAEAILTRLDFEDARDRLQEAFDRGRISAERYRAELAVLQERQDEFNRSINPIARAFDTLADGIVNAMNRVVAAITEAIAKALVLKGLGLIFPTGTFIGNIVEGISQGGARTPSPALNVGASTSTAPIGRVSGSDGLLRAIQENTAATRRMESKLVRVYSAGADRIAGTYADPHAARRARALADTQDALVRPRYGVV